MPNKSSKKRNRENKRGKMKRKSKERTGTILTSIEVLARIIIITTMLYIMGKAVEHMKLEIDNGWFLGIAGLVFCIIPVLKEGLRC